jgi:hypothetical protein
VGEDVTVGVRVAVWVGRAVAVGGSGVGVAVGNTPISARQARRVKTVRIKKIGRVLLFIGSPSFALGARSYIDYTVF